MPRIRAGGFLECCDMLRAGLVALRRFGVSVWFAMLRFGVTRRTGSRWHGMTYRECAAMRRYTSGRGARYGSLWFGSPGVGVRRFASPSPMARPGRVARYGAPVAQCRAMARPGGSLGCSAMFRLTGSRGPGRISSGTAAGSAALPSHCFHCLGHFSVGSGRFPRACCGIRAG